MSEKRVGRTDLDDAIAELARILRGLAEELRAGGLEHMPRASLAPVVEPRPAGPPPAEPAPADRPRSLLALAPDAGADDTDEAIARLLAEDLPPEEKLRVLQHDIIGDCRRCKLHRSRTNIAFGVGNARAELVFVGEGPGAEEDRQGVPFVGAAGQLLTKMIGAMGYAREDVYICNVVKSRPPNNRDPEPDEVDACERFLKAQLSIVRPRAIVALGRHATQTLLRTTRPISRLRGQWFAYDGIPLLPTFHPAFLLRSPEKKREAWEDLQEVMRLFGKESIARKER